MSMIEDWPDEEEQMTARARGCTCRMRAPSPVQVVEWDRDAYCIEHGDPIIMRATIDKLRSAIGAAFVKRFLD